MSSVSYVNGSYVDHSEARVSIEDRGYQFADGVYEVFAVINKKIVDYDDHLNRLFRSLKEISLDTPIAKDAYLVHIRNLVRKNYITNGIIYLQVSRGVASRDFKFPINKTLDSHNCKRISMENYYEKFKRGIKVKITEDLRWKRVDIKTLNLLPPVLAKQEAIESGCDEAWMTDANGYITEGSSSNAWILIKNKLITTPSFKLNFKRNYKNNINSIIKE